jgi:hypothetical protein
VDGGGGLEFYLLPGSGGELALTVLLPRLMVEGDLSSICCLVVDELHLLGDQSRGYLLELLLTKVRYLDCSSSLS